MPKWMVAVSVLLLSLPACREGTFSPDASTADAPPTQGTLSFSWRLTDGANDITCAQVAAIAMRALVTPSEGGFAIVDVFNCNVGSVTTRRFNAGTYDVVLELSAAEGLLAEAVRINDVEITAGGNNALGEFVFEIPLRGNLQFFIDTEALGLNCDAAPGGGGISQVVLELRDGANQCGGTFDIAAGATQPAGTYAADCATPYSCIENDQLITVSDLTSGAYQLTIRADKGGLPCYVRSPQFEVPGNNLTTNLATQTLVADPDVFGCTPQGVDAGVIDAGPVDAAVNDAGVIDAGVIDAP